MAEFENKLKNAGLNADEEKPLSGLLSQAPERAILISVDMPGADWAVEESLDELTQLATTAGVTCVDRVVQKLARPHPGTLLGSGKVEEIAELVSFHNCDAVIFDLELTPGQHRNLEKALETHVLDRTALILIIFGQRARTREGRLQVELAQVEYDLPRLTRQWSHLSRQRGGGSNQRGEGEKQIEVDRRLLRREKDRLLEELEIVRNQRQLHRERRKYTGAPVVSLVGYTNAGKSTLLNRLAGAQALAADKLFATLDPTTRRVRFSGGQEILLTDTVGFVQRLPTVLVAAFRATLEEVAEADLLVHVVDASHPHVQHQIQAVENVLEEIGAGGMPMVVALNKADLLPADTILQLGGIAQTLPQARVSALTGDGIDNLLSCISESLIKKFVPLDVLIPYSRGELVAQFHQFGTIELEEYEENGTHLRGYMPANHSGPFMALQIPALPRKVRMRA
ncbi:GTPase HflX [Ktedonosporobacter rubrisoli]|uniref:GTPase HflX n=1 Tax=Ktedonosporobacter rubrisoli TaxID=2509675 RepID=A0A4P6K1N1_KTERU|nr:GTPase HflX [Ktedonosporobacter rubrisoli]QBD81590.1 GTPase HflX [Ktedonosporobacter rubrisoli]